MSQSISLNGTWDLVCSDDNAPYYAAPELVGRTPLRARVPAPVHQVLMEAGLLEDPNMGLNSLKARWVEEQFWIYRRTFTAPAAALENRAWLTFGKLEYDARILLNGEEVGHHANAHRPARVEVTGKLREGENALAVILETGLHSCGDKVCGCYALDCNSRMTRRMWQRKPQYQCGWDWNPRLMNVGILGDVGLEWSEGPSLRDVSVFAILSPDLTTAAVHVSAVVESPGPAAVRLRVRLPEAGREEVFPLQAEPGETQHEVSLRVPQPRLWWPAGHGEQFLHTVQVSLESEGAPAAQTVIRRTGIRRVEIDQSVHPQEGRYFILRVNNRPIFCKGANWVPPDMLYSTVTPERTRELVRLASEANFNLLRVWGGGLYADHALCGACDEAGILLWHDFLFACAKYPGDDPGFAEEVRQEVTFGVRDLAHHPSLVVWCGNNEIAWGDAEWGWKDIPPHRPHDNLFFEVIPSIVSRENPSAVYWPSSPFSPEGWSPNDPRAGDQHPWDVSILHPGGADFWHYRTCVDRFPNEGGVMGASSPATLRRFLPEGERALFSPSWYHHDNPLACLCGEPGALGRAYQTVRLWTGRDPLAMDLEDYAFASALLQAEGLQEYILNYRRRMFSSASAVFWMYNDSWPVTHGWTIVDYTLRKKLAYHPVRRAFQPVTVALAEEEGSVTVYGINDTPSAWSGEVRYGLFTLAGERPLEETAAVTLPANASTPLARFPRERWERLGLTKSGAFALLTREGRTVAQNRLFLARFGDLEFAEPRVTLAREGETLTLSSPTFVWGLCLDVDGERPLADNCFDLLPGLPYGLPWPTSLGEPSIARLGSRDAVSGK